jgi:hypothetical protein
MSNAQAAFEYFVNQGMSPAQAAGIVGNLQGESGQGLNTGSINPGDGRDDSDSIGVAQWNGTRAQALKNYAASKGVPWTDLTTQLEFLHSELKGSEGTAYKGLQAAQTPEEAARAMLAYERPKGWDQPGSHPERAKYATAVYAAYGKPQATTPASPPGAPLVLPSAQQPVFAQPAQMPPQAPQQTAQMPPLVQAPETTFQAPPIQYAQRRPVNLAPLQAALQHAPFFAKG